MAAMFTIGIDWLGDGCCCNTLVEKKCVTLDWCSVYITSLDKIFYQTVYVQGRNR